MIETWSLLFVLAEEPKNKIFLIQDTDSQENIVEKIEDCDDKINTTYNNVKDLRSIMSGLEFFMKDRILKEENCPDIVLTQPDIEVYKENPRSHLPEQCQKELDK